MLFLFSRCTGQYPNGYPREQINKISAYIDGTGVYGSTLSRQNKLRSFKDGMMRLDADGLIPVSCSPSCGFGLNFTVHLFMEDFQSYSLPLL